MVSIFFVDDATSDISVKLCLGNFSNGVPHICVKYLPSLYFTSQTSRIFHLYKIVPPSLTGLFVRMYIRQDSCEYSWRQEVRQQQSLKNILLES